MKRILPSWSVISLLTISFSAILFIDTKAQTISTYAGGSIGEGRVGSTIGIDGAKALATDSSGNLYALVNNRLRKTDHSTGVITTVAGGGAISNGAEIAFGDADLTTFKAIGINKYNQVYIASQNKIWLVDTALGKLIHIAGTGIVYSGDNVLATTASFSNISSIATDTAGNLLICDASRIRKITRTSGLINTIAGNGSTSNSGDNGPALSAGFALLKSIAVDDSSNIFVLTSTFTVRKITAATSAVTTVVGTGISGSGGDGGLATAARLQSPNHIAVDTANNLYITDYARLRMVNYTSGIINTIAGSLVNESKGDGGPAGAATFTVAQAIAIAPNGDIFLSEFNSIVRKINKSTGIIDKWIGNGMINASGFGGPAQDAQLYQPARFAFDKAGNLYLSDLNGRIHRINSSTKQITTIAGNGSPAGPAGEGVPAISAKIGFPQSIAIDTAGNIYFVDAGSTIRRINKSTGILTSVSGDGYAGYAGDGGPASGAQFNEIHGLAFDSRNNLYIADYLNHRVRKIDAVTGLISTIGGNGTDGFAGDNGPAVNAQIGLPSVITIDANDNLYVSDKSFFFIRKINLATGIITTVAGNGSGDYSGDGSPATEAEIGSIDGLTTDNDGNLYLSDNDHGVIRKIDMSTGIIRRVAGSDGNHAFAGDGGQAIDALLNKPGNIQVNNGELFIADEKNSRIRKIVLVLPPAVNHNLKASVWYDLNYDGIKNPGESFADGIMISLTQDSTDHRALTRMGFYQHMPDTGSYLVQVAPLEHYTPYPLSYSGYNYSGSTGDSISFGLRPKAGHYDLSVAIIPATPVRTGAKIGYQLKYENEGTMTATSTQLRFIKSGKLVITATNPAYTSVSGDTLTWNLNSIAPAFRGTINIDAVLAAPPIANFGDSLYSRAIIRQANTDVIPSNDTSKLRQLVTGSYDPNDKMEHHGGYLSMAQIAAGEYLNYTIRFQNTGNDSAFKIVITDTLPALLDPASFKMGTTSHRYDLSIVGNRLTWTFDNILLPDSNTNEKASHGYINFRIKASTGISNGDMVKNLADIYFDLNPAVRTNTISTLVRDLPAAPVKPIVDVNAAGYCGALLTQKIKITNLSTAYKARVIVGTVAMPVGADSLFTITPQMIPPGTYNVLVQYINESGESSLTSVVKILKPAVPEVAVATNQTTITTLAEQAIITATNKAGGGLAPVYTFARNKSFTEILQAEGSAATYTVGAAQLLNGDNWIYVRMRTSETCTATATVIDSIKIAKVMITTSVTDIDNPGVTISAYPNPFAGEFIVKGLLAHKTYQVNVYDARGIFVRSYRISNKNSQVLNTIGLSTGNYWFSIIDLKKNKTIGTLKAIRR